MVQSRESGAGEQIFIALIYCSEPDAINRVNSARTVFTEKLQKLYASATEFVRTTDPTDVDFTKFLQSLTEFLGMTRTMNDDYMKKVMEQIELNAKSG